MTHLKSVSIAMFFVGATAITAYMLIPEEPQEDVARGKFFYARAAYNFGKEDRCQEILLDITDNHPRSAYGKMVLSGLDKEKPCKDFFNDRKKTNKTARTKQKPVD